MAIELNSFIAIKCVIDGLCETLGGNGPNGTAEGDAVRRIHEAPLNDLVTGVETDDWDRVVGLHLLTFVGGDCGVLTDDIKGAIWSRTLQDVEHYWHMWPTLPNPFPRNKFPQPTMDCEKTTVADLSVAVILDWKKAQG